MTRETDIDPTRSTGNVLEAIASKGRSMSSRSLLLFCAAGIILFAGVVAFLRTRWLLSLPGIALSGFGVWGLLDAHITRSVLKYSRGERRVLRGVQKTVAATGVFAAFCFIYAFFGRLLGAFIS
jgi:hypothetical protein